jgi:hypothetical protein
MIENIGFLELFEIQINLFEEIRIETIALRNILEE